MGKTRVISKGYRHGTRDKYSKKYRTKGRPGIARYLVNFKRGDYVDIVADPSIQKGLPYSLYHGRTGIVFNVNRNALGVEITKVVGNRQLRKRLHVRIEHVRKSRCNEAFKKRVKENDRKKQQAKLEGKSIVVKRQPEGPKPKKMVEATPDEIEASRVTAIAHQHVKRSQDLLLQITNHRDVQGLTPLHHASALGNYRAVQVLVANGADRLAKAVLPDANDKEAAASRPPSSATPLDLAKDTTTAQALSSGAVEETVESLQSATVARIMPQLFGLRHAKSQSTQRPWCVASRHLRGQSVADMPYITMCQGPKCTANGAGLIIRDMEDLAFGCATVEASGCMGQCSKGPNGMYSEKSGAKGKITNKLNKYSKLTDMIGEFIQGFALDDMQARVHRVKFAIRREENAEVRTSAIEETLGSIDDSQRALHPELVAQLLCLRARENLKADAVGAYKDLREALTLHPDWPWAFVTLAQVLDNLHMPRGALACMQKAIEIGTGVDKNSLQRGIVRLERKAADAKGPDPVPAGVEMDIAAIKDKSLGGGGASDKKDKKEKSDKEAKSKPAGKAASKAKTGKGKAKVVKETNKVAEETAAEAPKDEAKPEPPLEEVKEEPKEVKEPKEEKKEVAVKEPKEPKEEKKEKDKEKKHKKSSGHKKKKVKKDKGEEYQEWQLREREELNHDCLRMRFACKGKAASKFESTIWHIDLAANVGDDGEEIQRSYTPLSSAEDYKKGILELIIKVYPKGRMSAHLGRMKNGDSILVSRPVPTVDPEDYKEGGIMIAGGSAVVVALQVVNAILPNCTDSFHLYLCNRTYADVLLMDYFEQILKAYPNFKMTNCLSQGKVADEARGQGLVGWFEGRVSGDLLKQAPDSLKVLMSGPDTLCKMVAETFIELGRQEDDICCLDTDIEDLLNPEAKNEGFTLQSARSARTLDPPPPEPLEPVEEVPRARIK
ncbi:RPL21E, partial [Symbiodinium necroappetens]